MVRKKTLFMFTSSYTLNPCVSLSGINSVATATGPRVGLLGVIGGPSTAVDQAVADALSFGAAMVAPAGDDNGDACDYSPAREPTVSHV